MYFEQFYLGCLAHASYMLASEGEAVVVDPQRDVEIYLQAAEKNQVTIRHIFETHLHADFVSGHRELASRTGAQIYIGVQAEATFPHVAVEDAFQLRVGKIRITALETPGHTPESICLVIADEEKSPAPWAVLTGDTLFLGDVGRPDLSKRYSPSQLAGMLYDSLHNKVLKLADDVLVYPAHGAGSLCGRNMRAERVSTIGTERLTNYALQIKTREEFIKQLTSNLPARPEYFLQDAEINRSGAPALADLPPLSPIEPAELKAVLAEGGIALDVRPGEQFAAGHVPGICEHCIVRAVRFVGGSVARFGRASGFNCGITGGNGGSAHEAGAHRSRGCARIFARRHCGMERSRIAVGYAAADECCGSQ